MPPVYETLELQAERVMYQLRTFATTPLQKYDQLAQLAATNVTLYYKVRFLQKLVFLVFTTTQVLIDHLVELAPIVYTPTVGEACQKFELLYRAPLGMVCGLLYSSMPTAWMCLHQYLSAFRHRNRFDEVLSNWVSHNVQIIVVTDGGRILGLGGTS